MSGLSNTDALQIGMALESGALRKIEGHRIETSKGTIIVGCSDGDQFFDLFETHCKVCCKMRHHPLLLNGGALLLSPYAPGRTARTDRRVLFRHVMAATQIKGIHSVVLYTHAPCGVAAAHGLDFFEVMRLLVEAKNDLRAQRRCRELKMACFCHVDYSNGDVAKKKTYFVHRLDMISLLAANGRPVRS